jgi:hypothetical protein
MVNNCEVYDSKGSPCYDHAVRLEKYVCVIFPKTVVTSTASASIIDNSSGQGDVTIADGM